MPECEYCGRQNGDGAERCTECGTLLSASSTVRKRPSEEQGEQNRFEWLAPGLRYLTVIFLAALLYLLSFGPVHRYCSKSASVTPSPVMFTNNGRISMMTSVTTVKYPAWVGVVYYPVFLLLNAGGNNAFQNYVKWWNNSGSQRTPTVP